MSSIVCYRVGAHSKSERVGLSSVETIDLPMAFEHLKDRTIYSNYLFILFTCRLRWFGETRDGEGYAVFCLFHSHFDCNKRGQFNLQRNALELASHTPPQFQSTSLFQSPFSLFLTRMIIPVRCFTCGKVSEPDLSLISRLWVISGKRTCITSRMRIWTLRTLLVFF